MSNKDDKALNGAAELAGHEMRLQEEVDAARFSVHNGSTKPSLTERVVPGLDRLQLEWALRRNGPSRGASAGN